MPKIWCYYCGDPSYLIWKCLVRIKVRQLTIEKWKELMEDLNTLKNIENSQ